MSAHRPPWTERFARTLVRWRWIALLLVGCITVLLLAQVRSLEVRLQHETILPAAHPYVRTSQRVESLFGGRNQIVIGIVPVEGTVYSPDMVAVVRRVTDGLLSLPGIVPHQVLSLTSPQTKAILALEDGMSVEPLVPLVPTDSAFAETLRQRLDANPVYRNTIVSADGSTAIVIGDFTQTAESPSYRDRVTAVRALIEREDASTVRFALGGIAVNLAWLEWYSQEMAWLFGVALLNVMVVLYLSFRSLQGMIIPMCTALLSSLWALGIIAAAGVPLDIANVTTPILIMAIAAGHSIQMLKYYYEMYAKLQDQHEAVVAAMTRVGPVMLAAGTIAIVGFLSLLIFDIPAIRLFGLFTAAGVAAALILELTCIPALRACLPAPQRRDVTRHPLAPNKASTTPRSTASLFTPTNLSIPLLFGLGGLTLLVGSWLVTVDNSMRGNFQTSSQVRQDDTLLNQRMGGTNTLSLLIEGPTNDSLLEPSVLQAMVATQRFIERYDQVGKTLSLADYLARMNRVMRGDVPEADRPPESRELAAQYLLLYSSGGDPRDFDTLVDPSYRQAVITAYLKSDSTAYFKRLAADLDAFLPTVFPPDYRVSLGGGLAESLALNDTIVEGKLQNIVQVGLIIAVLSAVFFRSVLAGCLVTIPLMMAVIANFGVMGYFGIRLDIGTAIVAAMSIGIGADYSIYFLYRLREERQKTATLSEAMARTRASAGTAVLLVALSVGCGYAVLMISPFQFHIRMGLLVAVTMAASSVSTTVLLPWLLLRWPPRFVEPASPSLPESERSRLCA